MAEKLPVLLAGLTGVFLGILFFGGLWWTVRKGLVSKKPALWFFGSQLIRTGLTLAGFYFVSGSDWHLLVACLVGFLLVRLSLLMPFHERSQEVNRAH
jgi:F1F0 ATPase subunit 2